MRLILPNHWDQLSRGAVLIFFLAFGNTIGAIDFGGSFWPKTRKPGPENWIFFRGATCTASAVGRPKIDPSNSDLPSSHRSRGPTLKADRWKIWWLGSVLIRHLQDLQVGSGVEPTGNWPCLISTNPEKSKKKINLGGSEWSVWTRNWPKIWRFPKIGVPLNHQF